MDDPSELEAAYSNKPAPNRDSGAVSLIVLRGDGDRETPQSVRVTTEDGLVGDKWNLSDDPDKLAQVTLIMRGAIEVIAGDRSQALAGDNFVVDIDLAEDNVPAGTRIKVGSVLLEVTPEPHNGCGSFRERYGSAALRWVNHKDNRPRHLRGIHCKVLESGDVALGDAVTVVRRS